MNIQDLDQYVKSFPNSKDYQCALCEFISNRPAKVKNHLEAIHFPGVFVYSCDLCDKTFSGRNAFGVHKTTVHSKKKFTFWFQEQILTLKISTNTLASILTWRTIIVHCAKSFNPKNHPKWKTMLRQYISQDSLFMPAAFVTKLSMAKILLLCTIPWSILKRKTCRNLNQF